MIVVIEVTCDLQWGRVRRRRWPNESVGGGIIVSRKSNENVFALKSALKQQQGRNNFLLHNLHRARIETQVFTAFSCGSEISKPRLQPNVPFIERQISLQFIERDRFGWAHSHPAGGERFSR